MRCRVSLKDVGNSHDELLAKLTESWKAYVGDPSASVPEGAELDVDTQAVSAVTGEPRYVGTLHVQWRERG